MCKNAEKRGTMSGVNDGEVTGMSAGPGVVIETLPKSAAENINSEADAV
jgi:hypothetical protein